MAVSEHSESLDKLFPALIAAQAEFPSIPQDGYNPHYKSKFSTLKAVRKATVPVLAKHDLTITQFPSTDESGKPALTTWLAHGSGQYIKEKTVLSMSKSDPQAQGSAITYLRRYAWSSILGLVTDEDDDDGNKATLTAPKVSAAKLAEIKASAASAGLTQKDVETLARTKFGKRVPDLTPTEADEIAVEVAAAVATKELLAVDPVVIEVAG